MTDEELLDHFASQAMVALIKIIPTMRGPDAELCEFVSKTSYKLARAMMTERERQRI